MDEMGFLFGLGVVYSIAYRLIENVLVRWSLLIPMGCFYAQLDSGAWSENSPGPRSAASGTCSWS